MNPTRLPVVCHVVETLQYGGAESLVHRLAVGMNAMYEPLVCCLQNGPLAERLKSDGVRVEQWNLQRPSILNAPAFARFIYSVLRRLTTTIRDRHVAIVHAHLADSIMSATVAGVLTGTPVVGTYHGLGVFPVRSRFDPRNGIRRATYRLAAQLCARTVAVSPSVHDMLCGPLRFSPAQTVLIMNGVDVDAFARAADERRRNAGPRARRTITCVGRLVPDKGQRFLIEAMATVVWAYPDAELLLVGEGPYESALRQHAAVLGLTGCVRFAGVRHDVANVLAETDVFVLPSFAEGIPLALTEAMAAAVPVVVTDVAGNKEVVGDARHGVLVPARDAAALARAVQALLADPAEARLLGLRGQSRVREHFNFTRVLTATATLYDDVLRTRSGAMETGSG